MELTRRSEETGFPKLKIKIQVKINQRLCEVMRILVADYAGIYIYF